MAARNSKPTDKPNWIPDDATGISEPLQSKQNVGWAADEKPPAEFFNWFWNVGSRLFDYILGRADKYNIIIDSDVREGDYDTIAAYLADSPSAGDRVLVRVDQTLTATLAIPDNITIEFLDSVVITASTVFTPVVTVGENTIIKGILNLVFDHTGTITKAIEFIGDRLYCQEINVTNTSTGIITDAFNIASGVDLASAKGSIDNTGGGSITNPLVDSSGNDGNKVEIKASDELHRSTGANTFNTPFIDDFTGANHNHLDAAGGGAISANAGEMNVKANFQNLIAKRISATTVDIDADSAILFNISGATIKVGAINKTVDITSSGIDGLDTGSEAPSTEYHLWVIGKLNGTVATLISEESDINLITFPVDYTFAAYVGGVYNNSGSDLDPFTQRNNVVSAVRTAVLTTSFVGSYTLVDLADIVPLTAIRCYGTGSVTGNTAGAAITLSMASNTAGLGEILINYTLPAGGHAIFMPFELVMETIQTIYYLIVVGAGTANGSIWISGWEY